MNEGILKFICAITGHDEVTIKQMFNDWLKSPSSKTDRASEDGVGCVVSLPSKGNKCCELCKHCKVDNDITSASRGDHLCFNSKSDCYYLGELRNIKSFYCSEFARSN